MRFWNFVDDARGQMGIMLSLAAVPILVSAGAGIDILRANDTQTLLQAAVDSAAISGDIQRLTMVKNQQSVEVNKIKSLVQKYLSANGALDVLDSVDKIEVGVNSKSGNSFVRLNGKIHTSFMAVAGYSTMDVGAYAEIDQGSKGAEVALVLDNTASMGSQGRLVALKAASKNLIDTLFAAKDSNAYLKMGIVPFADYVNVGMANRNAPWMNVPADWTETLKNQPYVSYPNASGCHNQQGVWNNDGVPVPYTYQVCDNPGTPVTTYSDVTYTHQWYGCVGSRPDPLDRTVSSPSAKYPGILDTGCPSPITDLTDQQDMLKTQIDAMTAVGETYIPQGLIWGWNLLDSGEPYTSAKTKADMGKIKGSKSVVLMTDGENTVYPEYTPSKVGAMHHYSTGDATALKNTNDRMLAICANMKAEGITIYTVGFKVGAQASKDLLAQCASSPSQVYDADNDQALYEAFGQIATSLAEIHLAK